MTQFDPPAWSGAVKLFRVALYACVPDYELSRSEPELWNRRFKRGMESPVNMIALAMVTIAHRWQLSLPSDSDALSYVEGFVNRFSRPSDLLFSDDVERLLYELACLDPELIALEMNVLTGESWYAMATRSDIEHAPKSAYAEHPFMVEFVEQVITLYWAMCKSPATYDSLNEERKRLLMPPEESE